MTDTSTHRLYGLRVRSEVPLYQERPADESDVDVEILWGEARPVPAAVPAGSVLVRLEVDSELRYVFVTDPNGNHILRFCNSCEFVVAPDLKSVTAHAAPHTEPGMVGVLAAGALLSFILTLRGEPVLHASAVDLGEYAVAFVGASGMGKSTMAALMCAAGARLITDDVLRLDLSGQRPLCHLGATELRLRKAASEIAAAFASSPGSRRTSDDRDALQPAEATSDLLPLRAIIVPRPRPSTETIEMHRLVGAEALLALIRFPRIVGWENPTIDATQFAHLARIVDQVPIFIADVPWGPPFPQDIAGTVLAQVAGSD